MMLFKLQKNNNPEMKEAYGNYYACRSSCKPWASQNLP